jgi:hypothetical protein
MLWRRPDRCERTGQIELAAEQSVAVHDGAQGALAGVERILGRAQQHALRDGARAEEHGLRALDDLHRLGRDVVIDRGEILDTVLERAGQALAAHVEQVVGTERGHAAGGIFREIARIRKIAEILDQVARHDLDGAREYRSGPAGSSGRRWRWRCYRTCRSWPALRSGTARLFPRPERWFERAPRKRGAGWWRTPSRRNYEGNYG